MSVICAAIGCTNKFVEGSEMRYHRFPISKPQLASQWVKNMGMKDFLPTSNTCLCSDHFRPDCFLDFNGTQSLREYAVPTIFGAGQDPSKIELPTTMTKDTGAANRFDDDRQTMGAESKVYDSKGCMVSNGKDLCDCLDVDCTGCWYPCPECGSRKCGVECRCDREWLYDQVEVEGGEIIPNKYATY